MRQPESTRTPEPANAGGLRRWLRPAMVMSAMLLMAGCVAYDNHPRHGYPQGGYPQDGYPQNGYPHSNPGQPAMVPPGHMPPPGLCRIWYPDRPPGHQPAPDRCGKLQHHVPPGAYLIYG